MTRRLVLHIGTMKSGTTFLQHGLDDQREALATAGWLYPRLGGTANSFNQQGAVYSAFGHLIPWIVSAQHAEPGEVLVEQSRTSELDLLVSAEALASVDEAAIREILDTLGRDDVRVVITARDLARVLISAWQQGVKSGTGQSLAGYLTAVSEGREAGTMPFWRDFDLGAIVRRWGAVVGTDRVTVVTLPQRGADPGELWRRFVRAAGLPSELEAEVPSDDHGAANISLRVPELEVMLALNRLKGGVHRESVDGRELRPWLVDQWRDARGTDAELPGQPLRVPDNRIDDIRGWSAAQVDDCRTLGCGLEGDWDDLLVAEGAPTGPATQGEPASEAAAAALAVAADGMVRLWQYERERMRLNTKYFRDRELRNRVRRQVRRIRGRE